MRLTFRISTAGDESGFIASPLLDHPGERYFLANGDLDEARVRGELAHKPCVTFSGDDNKGVLSLAVEFLDRIRISLDNLAAEDGGLKPKLTGEKPTRAEKRMRKGYHSSVSVDIKFGANGYRVRISTKVSHNAVGGCDLFASTFARAFAETFLCIRDNLNAPNLNFTFTEGEGCAGVFAAARQRVNAARLRDEHRDCPSRVNGFCSPASHSCPLYRNGKCTWE